MNDIRGAVDQADAEEFPEPNPLLIDESDRRELVLGWLLTAPSAIAFPAILLVPSVPMWVFWATVPLYALGIYLAEEALQRLLFGEVVFGRGDRDG